MGGFSEGKVLVTWETSEYDEEWDTEFDEMIHYGLVDDTGALVVDLTDLVHGYGYTFQGNLQDASVTNSPTYADGRLVLFIEWSGGSYGAVVVLDEQGKVVFTVGDAEAFQFADRGRGRPGIHLQPRHDECPRLLSRRRPRTAGHRRSHVPRC